MKHASLLLAFLFCFAPTRTARAAGLHESIFLVFTGLGGLSTYLAETRTPEDHKTNFYAVQAEFYHGLRNTSVLSEGFGLERRLAPWFSIGVEVTVQQMLAPSYAALGASLNPQFKWYLLGDATLTPFIAYTSGLHYASTEFPQGGTQFTFRLICAIGIEYKLTPRHRARLSVGHLHQSNNNLLPVNPGYDGDGIALSYLWAW